MIILKSTQITHGKVILIGEHSVVFGYHALALPTPSIQIKTVLTDIKAVTCTLVTNDYTGELSRAPKNFAGIIWTVQEIRQRYSIKSAFELRFEGEIPEERGLGSSAAVALGTIKVMQEHFNLHLTKAEIIELANAAETINHGSASGLDVATVNSNHLVSFSKQSGPTEIRAKLGGFLVIADSGELGNTKEAVQLVSSELRQNPSKNNLMARLDTLATQALTSFEEHDAHSFGKKMTEANEILASFGLTTNRLDELINRAINNGALGSKISGGGLGGIVISLAETRASAQAIQHAQAELSANIWIEEI